MRSEITCLVDLYIFKATYKFILTSTVASWTDSILHPQIPVRAEVSGSQVIRTFHHIYDYFDFRDYVWEDDSAFEVR